MKPLKQFFSYFGSKVSLAKNYPAPEFDTIIEPFAGSAGYACRFPDRAVLLFDADPVIVGVWNYLISASPADILGLPLDPDDVSRLSKPERDFIGFWWRRCGATPSLKPVPWMRSGRFPHSFWSEQTRARIAGQVKQINHWKCFCRPYDQVRIERATWFIDPPYQAQGGLYTHGSKGIDYAHLAAWVRSLPGQIVACESAGADWLPFRPLYENRTVKYKKAKRTIIESVFLARSAGEAPCAEPSIPFPSSPSQETP